MEWITTTAKTLPEAIDLALDNLGVDESEAEIVIKEEPRQGFFGRLKGVARVEARILPKSAASKNKRSRKRNTKSKRPPKGNNQNYNKRASSNTSKSRNNTSRKPMVQEQDHDTSVEEVSEFLNDYLSGLSKAFGYGDNVSITGTDTEGLTASIEGQRGLMIGPKGRTLNAIQELTRVSVQRSKPNNYRVYVDIGGYREKRREALQNFANQAAEKVKAEGIEVYLDPMSSADRKVVHDTLNEIEGIETRSSGVEPRRRVIVVPASAVSVSGE